MLRLLLLSLCPCHFCSRHSLVEIVDLFFKGIDRRFLGAELLSTDFHNLILQRFDLLLDTGSFTMEFLDFFIKLRDFLLQRSHTAVIGLRWLMLLAQFLDSSLSVSQVPCRTLNF